MDVSKIFPKLCLRYFHVSLAIRQKPRWLTSVPSQASYSMRYLCQGSAENNFSKCVFPSCRPVFLVFVVRRIDESHRQHAVNAILQLRPLVDQ